MPPKPSTSRGNPEVGEAEVLQAVILADSFNKRFKPLTADRPKVLASRTLPLYHLNCFNSVYFLYAMRLSWTGR